MSTRRQFVQWSGGAVALGLTACGGGGGGSAPAVAENTENTAQSSPALQQNSTAASANLPPPSAELHLLKRASWGPGPDELARLTSLGIDGWLDEQLDPNFTADADVETEVNFRWPTVNYSACRLAQLKDDGRVMRELRAATLFRRIFSRKQLFEVMVDFWSDHFTVYHGDGIARHMKTLDDREVIRANALGSFSAMLRASARSPAMLEYLDNRRSTGKNPNENYARELLELHTLGVDGGYTEADIKNVARAFTGWSVQFDEQDQLCLFGQHSTFVFNSDNHDSAAKTVLGHSLAANRGMEDGDDVLDILVAHPATRRHIARKLYRRFVADGIAPAGFVDAVAAAWGSDGDIPAMLRQVFASSEFRNSADAKLTRPQEGALYLVRALDPQMDNDRSVNDILEAAAIPDLYSMSGLANIDFLPKPDYSMFDPLKSDFNDAYEGPNSDAMISRTGHVPFQWPSPNGYPDVESYWASVNGLLERWRYTIQVAGQQREDGLSNAAWAAGQETDPQRALANMRDRLLMRELLPEQASALLAAAGVKPDGGAASTEQFWRRLMALLVSSPYALRR
ncbi:MAG: DUF1800 domain-containing protein [Spongiibacter sp.]|nr:DUF1800 domain-containing protein [Spongiibacter sp.]